MDDFLRDCSDTIGASSDCVSELALICGVKENLRKSEAIFAIHFARIKREKVVSNYFGVYAQKMSTKQNRLHSDFVDLEASICSYSQPVDIDTASHWLEDHTYSFVAFSTRVYRRRFRDNGRGHLSKVVSHSSSHS